MQIRVVMKDSISVADRRALRYRCNNITGYRGGWIISIPGDNNIYKTHYDAKNAIDKALGFDGRDIGDKRRKCGIRIIGAKE